MALIVTARRARASFAVVEPWGHREVGAALATLAHGACHIWAVRKMLLAARSRVVGATAPA